MYQSSQYNIRPQTSGVRDTLSNGGILTGGADIDQNDDGFSYTTSQKSLKSSTIRVSTAGRSIKSRRQLSILGKDGKVSSASRKSQTRPLEQEIPENEGREDSKPALSYRSLKVYFQGPNPQNPSQAG
jgi:hypothetical protein